jgi:hypothetical protein
LLHCRWAAKGSTLIDSFSPSVPITRAYGSLKVCCPFSNFSAFPQSPTSLNRYSLAAFILSQKQLENTAYFYLGSYPLDP